MQATISTSSFRRVIGLTNSIAATIIRIIDTLMAYDWPGNVRELENLIERALIQHRGKPLRFDDLSSFPVNKVNPRAGSPEDETIELDVLIKRHIERVLEKTASKIHGPGGAGELLGVNPDTLRYRMKKLGIPFRKKRTVDDNQSR